MLTCTKRSSMSTRATTRLDDGYQDLVIRHVEVYERFIQVFETDAQGDERLADAAGVLDRPGAGRPHLEAREGSLASSLSPIVTQ